MSSATMIFIQMYDSTDVLGDAHHAWCNSLISAGTVALHDVHAVFSTRFSTETVDRGRTPQGELT
jgi:hypothetical protein